MTRPESPAEERVRLRRQLAEVGDSWRDAARRRVAARDRDPVEEARAQTAIEAGFRARSHIVARLAELEQAERRIDAGTAGVRQSSM